MDKEQAIKYIQQQIDKIDIDKFTIGDDSHIYLEEWQDSTKDILKEVVDKSKVMQFSSDMWHQSYYMNTNNIKYKRECIEKLKLKLNRYIDHIKKFDLKPNVEDHKIPSSNLNNGINIYTHNNNHNNQTQELMNISIIVQNIFEGLSASEKEELKKVLQQYYEDKNRNNLIQSLQSMGKGVLENILANLITNPSLIGKMIDIL